MKLTYSYCRIISLLFFLITNIIASRTFSADAELHGSRISIRQVTLEGEDKPSSILAEEMNLFADGAIVIVHKANGETETMPIAKKTFYRGSLEGEEGSIVVISIDNDDGELKGSVSTNNNNWSLSGSQSKRIESKKDVEPRVAPRSKQWTEAMGNDYLYPGELSTTFHSHVSPSALRQNQYYIAQISIETDAELYNHFGNTKDATDYITSVMAFSSAIYAKEVGIVLRIQSISLWTDGIDSDPWVTVNPSASINTSRLLFDFKDYWNRINPDSTRAAALFISGRPVPLGISYPGGLCEQSYALVTGLEYSPLISNGLVWDNYVVSHELGHLFGSPHSHEYKNIDGEPNGIDSCVTGDNFNAVPSGKVPGINTLDTGILGSRSGTIMSYCDHNYRGLKNIAPSFGNNFQYGIKAYREANLITESAASKHQSSPGCIKVETISNPPTYTPLPRSTKWNLRKTTFSDGSTLEGYIDFNSYLSSYNYSRLVYTDISGQHPLTVVGAYSDEDIKLSVDGKQDSLAASLEMNESLLTANDKISLFVNVGGCRLYIGLCYGISWFSSVLCGKSVHTVTGFWKGLAGRFESLPVVRKMMLVRLRSDLNPLALTIAA